MFEGLKVWQSDSMLISEQISSRIAPFKILLKIKDDVFFARRWIKHHASIVGIDNLIIFDNMSASDEMSSIYREFHPDLLVFRFGGFHNNIHRVHEYPLLYNALRRSCKYFLFLDSDEYLVKFERDFSICNDKSIVDGVINSGSMVLPGSWLENVAGYSDRFWYDPDQNHAATGLRSGKPIVSVDAKVEGLINHNRQISFEIYDENVRLNYFILHLKRLSPDQRIRANMLKLEAYNAFKTPVMLSDIIMMNPDDYASGNKRNWIREIQNLHRGLPELPSPSGPLAKGTVGLSADGFLCFQSGQQETIFTEYLSHPWKKVNEYLRVNPEKI